MQRGFHEPVEKPRRFYKVVEAVPADGGYAILLDGRRLRTPKGETLTLPTEALARMVADEWAGQGETIELAGMHAARLANTAIESIPKARESTADTIAGYAGTDLLCYFAEGPAGLVARQEADWTPLTARAEAELGLAFLRATGIVHRPQPQETTAKVRQMALELDDFALAGLAFAAALFGSAVLALAVQRGWISGEQAFDFSRLDETWQEAQWGVDDEAAQRTERLRGEARMLDHWFKALAPAG